MKPFLLSGALMVAAGSASASTYILDFEGDICQTSTGACSNNQFVNQTYGDEAGVDVVYDGNTQDGGLQNMQYYGPNYSDLNGIAYGTQGQTSSISFVATGPDAVTVNSFDLGAWPSTDRTTSWTVFDLADDSVLASSGGSITVDGDVATSVSGTWTSSVGIGIFFGPDAFNVGIDNITYSVAAIPLPASGLVLLTALAGVGALRRRKA